MTFDQKLNLLVLLSIVGVIVYMTCLGSTTWGDR